MDDVRRTTETIPFACRIVGRRVTLTIHTVEEPARSPAPPSRRIERAECDQCQACGVGEQAGEVWTYRWRKCIHPVLQRQG
jgi:hypothetical protein